MGPGTDNTVTGQLTTRRQPTKPLPFNGRRLDPMQISSTFMSSISGTFCQQK